jgi:hypothetical protein
MTRKRSKYRPKGVIRDTMQFVLTGMAPITTQTDANIVLRVRNNAALRALTDGSATAADIDVLISVSNMGTALKRLGKGQDWAEELRAGTDALEAVQLRWKRWGKVQATPSELTAITLMVDIHEAQLDASRVIDIEKALDIAQRGVASLHKGA